MKPHPTLAQLVSALTDFFAANQELKNEEVVLWESAGMWEHLLDFGRDRFGRPAFNANASGDERE
jgi:hypothetical protein